MKLLKFKSLKSRFFFTFLLFTSITLFVAISSFWFYQRASELSSISIHIEDVLIDILRVIKEEQDFFNYEAINPSFFQTEKSEYLKRHENLIQKIRQELYVLLQQKRTRNLNVEGVFLKKDIKEIIYALEQYQTSFKELVELTKQRGFKDDGIVGQMRANIHELEDLDYGLTLEDILTLRRHEKDFLLRKDLNYARKLRKVGQVLLNKLNNQPNLTTEQRVRVITFLRDYLRYFQQLERIELAIGNNILGMQGKMRQHADQVASLMEELLKRVSLGVDNLKTRQFQVFISIILGSMVVSLFLSYWLAVRVTSPVRQLTQRIRETVDAGFQNKSSFLVSSSEDEIGELGQNFELMLQEIQVKLLDIQEKNDELAQQNEELNAVNLHLKQSEQRLNQLHSVKDRFFSIISHDLRGPLRSLLAYLKVMEEDYQEFSPEEIQKYAIDTQRSLERVLRLLENLLNWSLSQTGEMKIEPTRLHLNSVVRENIALYKETAREKDIRLSMDIPDDLFVWTDANMLDFVLRNLTSNAIKFSQKGSEVQIKAEKVESEIKIAVKDQGVGMSQAFVDKLLKEEKRQTTLGTSEEKGTGFGLLMCKNFIENNQGTLQVQSTVGEGTEVYFNLPEASAEPEQNA